MSNSSQIPNINVSKSVIRNNRFNKTHDVNTTAGFGDIQPYMCLLMNAGSSARVQIESLVRLMPLVAPTFSRMSHRVYHQFVPIQELIPNYGALMSGTKYNTEHTPNGYIPDKVPTVTPSFLFFMLASLCQVKAVRLNGSTGRVESWSSGDSKGQLWFSSLGNPGSNGWYGYSSPNFLRDSDTMTAAEADFITFTGSQPVFAFLHKLSPAGKRLRKILIGLGYQIDATNHRELSALPLFAFAKAYFDVFGIQQSQNWNNSNAFRLLDFYCETGSLRLNLTISQPSTQSGIPPIKQFFGDLTNSWYTADPDFVSAHLDSVSLNQHYHELTTINFDGRESSIDLNILGAPSFDSGGVVDQNSLNYLKTLYTWTNKNTIIGQRVGEYLRVHLGENWEELMKSNFIGSEIDDIQVNDVVSTADTASASGGAFLGESGGRGLSYKNGDSFTYKTDKAGFWIAFSAIIPHGGYNQGIDGSLSCIDRFSFYNPEFDGLGLEITPFDVIKGAYDVTDTSNDTKPESFGFIPRYSYLKTQQNILNGDMSLRSQRNFFLPYQLDRHLTDNDVDASTDFDGNNGSLFFHGSEIPTASIEWRYPTRYAWLGNFNRIFANWRLSDDENYDATIEQDNFIVHNIVNVDYNAPMKSIADSFETFDEGDNGVVSINKA